MPSYTCCLCTSTLHVPVKVELSWHLTMSPTFILATWSLVWHTDLHFLCPADSMASPILHHSSLGLLGVSGQAVAVLILRCFRGCPPGTSLAGELLLSSIGVTQQGLYFWKPSLSHSLFSSCRTLWLFLGQPVPVSDCYMYHTVGGSFLIWVSNSTRSSSLSPYCLLIYNRCFSLFVELNCITQRNFRGRTLLCVTLINLKTTYFMAGWADVVMPHFIGSQKK